MPVAHPDLAIQQWVMLTEQYVNALLIDADLADEVWELWDARLISDEVAAVAWWQIAGRTACRRLFFVNQI